MTTNAVSMKNFHASKKNILVLSTKWPKICRKMPTQHKKFSCNWKKTESKKKKLVNDFFVDQCQKRQLNSQIFRKCWLQKLMIRYSLSLFLDLDTWTKYPRKGFLDHLFRMSIRFPILSRLGPRIETAHSKPAKLLDFANKRNYRNRGFPDCWFRLSHPIFDLVSYSRPGSQISYSKKTISDLTWKIK